MGADQTRQVHVGQVIAADDDERVVLQELLGALDAAGISPELLLALPEDLHAPALAISKIFFDLIAQIVQVDGDLRDPVLFQQLDKILHYRAVDDGHERLGDVTGQGIEAGTDPGGQYHRFHSGIAPGL